MWKWIKDWFKPKQRLQEWIVSGTHNGKPLYHCVYDPNPFGFMGYTCSWEADHWTLRDVTHESNPLETYPWEVK